MMASLNADYFSEGVPKETVLTFLVSFYFSVSLFPIFWLNSCKECQFRLHKYRSEKNSVLYAYTLFANTLILYILYSYQLYLGALPNKIFGFIGCICLTFLDCLFSNETSNYLHLMMQSHILFV